MLGVLEGVLSPVVRWQRTLTDYGVVRRGFLCVPRYNVRRLAVQVHQGPSRAVLSRYWVFPPFIFYRFGAL